MKKLLATFAILALCAVNAMATDVVKTAEITVKCPVVGGFSFDSSNDTQIDLTNNAAMTKLEGQTSIKVNTWTNATNALLTFAVPASVPYTSLGATGTDDSVTIPVAQGIQSYSTVVKMNDIEFTATDIPTNFNLTATLSASALNE